MNLLLKNGQNSVDFTPMCGINYPSQLSHYIAGQVLQGQTSNPLSLFISTLEDG